MSDLDEHLPAIARGDADAFARWLAAAEPSLRRSLRSFATKVDIEAVLQESLLRTWQVAADHCQPDGKPNGLLRLALRIARNRAIDEARRHRTAHVELLEQDLAQHEPVPVDPSVQLAVRNCRDRLPRRPALALTARIDDAGLQPDRTLAAKLGMKPNTFLQNITRARRLLAACLRKSGIQLPATVTVHPEHP
ncbi:MAG: RNA polymerase sigma factor [Planctomycetota bacterium]